MATQGRIWMNRRLMGESAEKYVPGRFCPIHLGDVLQGRYHVFRKLGSGGQCTVWLARDKSVETRRYVALKVFSVQDSSRLDHGLVEELLQKDAAGPEGNHHPGKVHVELALDKFQVQLRNGQKHVIKVLEPLGQSLNSIMQDAASRRAELNGARPWLGAAVEGDGWSTHLAKRACYQVLLGLDYLHSRRLAHGDVRPANVCTALREDLSKLGENEIQQQVWRCTEEAGQVGKKPFGAGCARIDALQQRTLIDSDWRLGDDDLGLDLGLDLVSRSGSGSGSGSDYEEEEGSKPISPRLLKRLHHGNLCRALTKQQWAEYRADPGDASAEPHTLAWNKANFVNSARHIELLHRVDLQPPRDGEIRYTVAAAPLRDRPDTCSPRGGATLELRLGERLVLVDLGLASPFSECQGRQQLANMPEFTPPEALLPGRDGNGLPCSRRGGDIFSLGLLFWNIVMLRPLTEPVFFDGGDDDDDDDAPHQTMAKNQLLRNLAQRIGPFPAELRPFWPDADGFVDSRGRALDNIMELYGEEPEPGDFMYGDIWDQARQRKPSDMSDGDLECFLGLLLSMLRWKAEERPSTAGLLGHEWFKELRGEEME